MRTINRYILCIICQYNTCTYILKEIVQYDLHSQSLRRFIAYSCGLVCFVDSLVVILSFPLLFGV